MRTILHIVGHGLVATTLMFAVGCDEKAAPAKAGGTTSTKTTEDPTAPSDNLCTDLKADSAVYGAHKTMINLFCGSSSKSSGLITQLRQSDRVYKGGAPIVTDESSEESNQRSRMKLYTSNIYNTDATSYFKMMKLQMFDTPTFKSAGFETDANTTYTVQSKDKDTSVSFNYVNDAETTVIVNYDAKTTFYTVKSSDTGIKRYIVGTKLTKSNETVVELEGVVVINEYKADGQMVAEVFTLSNQLYDNNNDHATTLKKAKSNIETEQVRSFKNAGKSRAYFKE